MASMPFSMGGGVVFGLLFCFGSIFLA
ncbi:hypothetical protein A2U01_0072403, partial [Trifolium medium]|nr:hypothetical protein [Trifolium medium]